MINFNSQQALMYYPPLLCQGMDPMIQTTLAQLMFQFMFSESPAMSLACYHQIGNSVEFMFVFIVWILACHVVMS